MKLLIPLTLLLPSVANAQFAADQAKSLRGAQTVQVVNNAGMDQPSLNWLTLELRKTGLMIVPAGGTSDIVLNVSIRATRGSFFTDTDFRLDVEQMVDVARTGERLQLVTWFYQQEQNMENGQWTQARWTQTLQAGVNQFLSDWLTANGR